MARSSGERARFEILLEEVQSQLHAVAEGHGLLDRKMDEFRRDVEQRFTTLETAMTTGFRSVNHRMDRFEQRMDGLEGRMGGLEHRMDGLEGRMGGLEHRMDGFDHRMDLFEHGLSTHTHH